MMNYIQIDKIQTQREQKKNIRQVQIHLAKLKKQLEELEEIVGSKL